MEVVKQIDLSWLIPDLSKITFLPQNGSELSILFIVVLLAVFSVFSITFLYHFVKTLIKIKWLNSQLTGLDRHNIADKRESLYLAAQNKKNGIGHLWLEFDETLVEVKSDSSISIRNTLDAGHFFNTHTIAKQVTENRLIAAVPGFLTAIGVIGTFVGLQLGLAGLELGAGVSVETMQNGVSNVVSGAKVAFLTSVWGVALSVLFNFGEKWFEQRVRNSISRIEDTIDRIFPRIRPEDQLQQIAYHSYESREALQGLAEKIGTKMQEAMVTATEGIQSSLEKSLSEIMAPAINKLVDETSQGNQKALDGLLQNFMDGFGQQGGLQRQALDDVSEKVNRSVEAMQISMNGFVEQLQRSQSNSGEREKELIADISNQVSRLVTQNDVINDKLTGFVENKVNAMSSSLDAREQASAKREEELVNTISNQVSELVTSSREQGKVLTEFVGAQLTGITQTLDKRDERVALREESRDKKITAQSEAVSKITEQMLASVETSIQSQVSALVDNSHEQSKTLTEFVDTQLTGITQALNKRDERVALREEIRDQKISAQSEAVSKITEQMLASVETSIKSQVESSQALIHQGKSLQTSVETSVLASAQATQAMKESATELRTAADKMSILSAHINEAGNKLSGAIKEAVDSTKDLAQQNYLSAERMESLRSQLIEDVGRFDQLTAHLTRMLSTAENTFSELKVSQKQFISQLSSEVEGLSSKMTVMLEDYASQANATTSEHLKVWSDSVTQYSTQMTSAVRSLSSVVDSMDDKLGK
jgi:uncharacterized protein YidB (DUF937 family)